MGWWTEKEGVALVDEVFDETAKYLEALVEIYREAEGRKPTVEEVATLWTQALLGPSGPETFDGFDQLEVSAVLIKTKNRPKRQRIQEGDVFTIPLEAEKWGFGRVVKFDKNWELVEVFAYVSSKPRYTPDALAAGRLFPPIPVGFEEAFFEGAGKWRVVHSQPGFRAADLDELAYAFGGDWMFLRVNGSGAPEKGAPAYVSTLPELVGKVLVDWEDDIKSALRARGLLNPKPAK